MIDIELGRLPWFTDITRSKLAQIKLDSVRELFKGSHALWKPMYNNLIKLTYDDAPNYDEIRQAMLTEMHSINVNMDQPYDWQVCEICIYILLMITCFNF